MLFSFQEHNYAGAKHGRELRMTAHGTLTITDRDQLDFPVGAIADYAATLRLIAETTKSYDDDTSAAISRIGDNLDQCVQKIRAYFDTLQRPSTDNDTEFNTHNQCSH